MRARANIYGMRPGDEVDLPEDHEVPESVFTAGLLELVDEGTPGTLLGRVAPEPVPKEPQ